MSRPSLPDAARTKIDVLFEGVRYSSALGAAAAHAFPNFYPYRFRQDEPNPTGKQSVSIPYLMTFDDGTMVRLRGDGRSPWSVSEVDGGYALAHRDGGRDLQIDFEPLPDWMNRRTSDGFPMSQAGVSLHGDMAVINVAPACEYFRTDEGEVLRCTFCAYGAPDARSNELGQVMRRAELADATYQRMQETLVAALDEGEIRHIYLVGGSMLDWQQEARRYMQFAEKVQEVNKHRIPVACGSGALPEDSLRRLHGEGLVDSVCFNLEVWSEPLFARIAPGKNRFVGYRRWIESLELAVQLFGVGRVYSAMVAGIELEPEYGIDAEEATRTAIDGAKDLCSRGIIPLYSLYYPLGKLEDTDARKELRDYFEAVSMAYRDVRERLGIHIWDGFMCHRCAYMQLECDLDRDPRAAA